MPIEPFAAERTWFGVAPDGAEKEVVLRIGVPTVAPGGEWRSTVSLGILESRTYDIAGIDAWQAISLSMRFAASRIGHFAENGWKFYWERDGELALPADLADAP